MWFGSDLLMRNLFVDKESEGCRRRSKVDKVLADRLADLVRSVFNGR